MPYDAIVLGLGGMGSAALAQLARRGRRVLGLEQFSPGHALGSSHGGSRIIRQAYFEDPAYVPLLLRAYELWAELEQRSGRTLLTRTGGLMAGTADSEVVAGSLRSAKEYRLAHELLSAGELRRRFPVLRPLDDEVAVYEPNAGVLAPEECVLAQIQDAVAAGGEARFGVRVASWQVQPSGAVRVHLPEGDEEAERLLICAGPWLAALAPDLGVPLHVERQVMHWWQPAARAAAFAPDRFPIWVLQRQGRQSMYGFPALPGQGVKAAFHHGGAAADPDALDRVVAPREIEAARLALRDWIPDAIGPHRRSAVCMYTNTPDEHFLIAPHPRHAAVIVAGGFSGHGFKFCPVVGEILAHLAIDGVTPHPIARFAPARFAPAPAPGA